MPCITRNSGLKAVVGVLIVLAVAGMSVYYYRHDPSHGGLPCTFKYVTGYDCPGCGSQRAFHALLHGRMAEAWHFNAMVFFAVPLAVFYFCIEYLGTRRGRLHRLALHPVVILTLLLCIVLWWIGRNL